MPDKRSHRGAHPADNRLFAEDQLEKIRQAVTDFSLLLTKGYAPKSSLKLVGDRFSLTKRQRLAVMRSACSDNQLQSRLAKEVSIDEIKQRQIAIDGYNLLITIESALSGAMIIVGRDGTYKDLASVHGTYRKVEETAYALELIGDYLEKKGVTQALWYLDSPVSNSGRLKRMMEALAREKDWHWNVELVINPDAVLCKTKEIAASSDSTILDGCREWLNLARWIIDDRIKKAWIVDLRD